MLKNSKRVSLFIALAMILQVVAPIGQAANAKSFDNVQTFSLPMVEETDEFFDDDIERLASTEENEEIVKEFDFKGDKVKVYINTDIKYPIFGEVPVVIRLECTNRNVLDYADYTIIFKDGENKKTLSGRDIEARHSCKYYDNEEKQEVNLLGLFPDTISPGDYEISLEVNDTEDPTDSVETENMEELEDPIEEVIVEKPEEQEENPIEEVQETEEPIKEESIEKQEVSKEEIVEETEEVKEPVIPVELDIESEVIEEEIIVSEEPMGNSFSTGFIPITLSYEDIIEEDRFALDSQFYLQLRNIAKEGKVEAQIMDDEENIVYTTTEVFGRDRNDLRRERYYIDKFGSINDYEVYSGHVYLYKCGDANTGKYTFVLSLNGEEIYTKDIRLVDKHPVVDYVQVDKYVLSGDREFKLEVSGEYLTKKDDIELKVVDEKGNTVAKSIDSGYKSYSNSGHTQILYTMEVADGQELVDGEKYNVELKYKGTDDFEMKAKYVTIETTTSPKVVKADTSLAHMGILRLEGVNFSEDDEYIVEIRQNRMDMGKFKAEFIDSRTLSVGLGEPLEIGDYDITVGRVYNNGDSWNYVGNIQFYYRPDFMPEEPIGDPVLCNTYPSSIPQDITSYSGEIIARNLSFDFDGIEIQLVDGKDNLIGDSEIIRIQYYSDGRIKINFNMNISGTLNLNEEYFYVFKCDGEEIKTATGERLKVKVTDQPNINDIHILGAIDRYDNSCPLVGIDKGIEFELSGMNINDLSKLNVYIRDSNGNKVAELMQDSLEVQENVGIENYSGKMNVDVDEVKSGVHEVVAEYDGQELYSDEIEITTEIFVDYIRSDRFMSTNVTNSEIELYRVLNVDKDKLDISIYDLLGNKINTSIVNINEEETYEGSGEKKINISLNINEQLKNCYYELRIHQDSDDLFNNHNDYGRRIYVTDEFILTGSSWSDRFQKDDICMDLTRITEAINLDSSQKYTGYFYLREDEHYSNNLKYVGTAELTAGEMDGMTGIIFPPEKFIDYPVGRYEVFIEDANGELIGDSYFRIEYKHGGTIEPDEKNPIFVINNGSKYINNRGVTLSINSAGYTLVKIANTEEELETVEPIAVKNQVKWTLPEGDGEKTVYVQFLDAEGNSSEILTQTVILDTIAPKLIDASVSRTEQLVIGDEIYINASSNEKIKAYAVLYKDGEEIKTINLKSWNQNEDAYNYRDWISIYEEIDEIKVYVEDLAGNKSEEKTFDIKMGKAVQLSGYLYKDDKPVSYHDINLYEKIDGNYQWVKWTSTDRYGYYDFKSIPAGEYKIIAHGPRGYKDIEREISVHDDYNSEELIFESLFDSHKNLTIVVKDNNSQPVKGAYIYIYGYMTNIYENYTTDEQGKVSLTLPVAKDTEYDVYLNVDGYSDNRTITLTEDMELEITVPKMKTLKGTATIGEEKTPVEGAEIRIFGGGQYYYTTTNSEGKYEVKIEADKEYTLKVNHPLYTAMEHKIATHAIEQDIALFNKVKVFGTLSDSSGNPLPNVDIYASGDNDWQRVRTNDKGEYGLRLGYGNYTISHGWVEGYISKYDDIKVEEGNFSLEHNITLESYDYDNSFSGDGNNVKADVKTIQRGKTFNLVVNYKNNGPKVDSGKVSVDLPAGLEIVGGNTEKSITNLKRGQSGQLLMTVKVLEEYKGNKIIIPGKVMVEEKEYAIGFAEIDVIDVTLIAPELVPDGNFKVYGEATPGSNVAIIDKATNKVLATSKTIGRWYSADIKGLGEGKYEIFAKAEKDGQVAISETVNVEVDSANGIKVEDIEVTTPGGQKIGMNPEIGVPAFTAWTGINLDGRNIYISVELSKDADSVNFIFAGKEYNATKDENGRWNATFSNWSATGTQQIFMEITIGDRTIKLIVGEVIILIDPSGYVYDTYTGERIEGARVTCEVWEGNEWKIWDSEIYGQINPQLTDKEGNYGWMVPEGKYRVRVDKEGYESKTVGSDSSIIIPPPRTDVNIGLTSLTKTYDEVVRTGFYLNQTRGKKFIDIYNFLNPNKEYREAITAAGLENVLFVHQSGQGAKLSEILNGNKFRPLKPEDFESSYKDVTTGGTIKPILGLKLLSFEVEDDKISVWFEGIPVDGEPAKEDFKITRKIDGVEKEVAINSIEWNFETRKAVLTIDKSESEEGQNVEYTVKYK